MTLAPVLHCGKSMDAESIWQLVREGQYLAAHDEATASLREDPDPEVKYLSILALKRSGAIDQAMRRLDEFGLESIDPGDLTRQLAEDVAALRPGLAKELALRSTEVERERWARTSAEGYEGAFTRLRRAYLAANAATMWVVVGELDKAETAAAAAIQALLPLEALENQARYWEAATESEAAIVLGDTKRAENAIAAAADLSAGAHSSRATTTRQLRMLCALLGVEGSIVAPLSNPAVVHYCGHRILAPGEAGRFPAQREDHVADELRLAFDRLGVGFGFGSLAAGADILAAEALLARDAELHVTLPFSRSEFVEASVAPAGDEWVARFELCVTAAKTVTNATTGEYLNDPVLFDFCSRVAMGDALMRARDFDSEVHQVAVWDGIPTGGTAGTALDVAHWRANGRPSVVVPIEPSDIAHPIKSGGGQREIRGVVFGDFAGFSRLTDAQLLTFQDEVMGRIAAVITPFRRQVLSSNTWGDGLYMVFDSVTSAAECAVAIQRELGAMSFEEMGLDGLGRMRLAAHAAPVFEGRDPISGDRIYFGSDVTKTARVEPSTPEGEIYVTHPFAALTALSGEESFETQYVGTLPTAKGFGDLPLFSLHRRHG